MSSKNRREQSGLDVTSISPNGKQPAQTGGRGRELGEGKSGGASASRGAVHLGEGHGKIEVSSRTISHLASRATQRSYGVVGLVPRHSRPGWVELLRGEDAYKGVDVSFPDGHVLIELYVVIEYGTRISEVARNIMSNVKFAVESSLGVPVVQVNVNVQDIRVSEAKGDT